MPIHFRTDRENQIVLTTFSRATNVNDFVEHAAKLAADPDFHPGFGELVEFIDDASMDLSYADLKSVLEHDPFSTVSKRAVVVYSEAALLASIRMYQVLRDDGAPVRIFATKTDALSWLIPPEK